MKTKALIQPKTTPQRAFTLVELSIVLVILGLLVGGVLTGQSLIRAAELRSITTQYNQYVTAVHTFRDKYFALPGDMANAQSFWGVAHATPATCRTTASTTATTCNGDGDGRITSSTGADESYRLWQHLANAGLIEGSYTGVADATNGAVLANSPVSKMQAVWYLYYIGPVSGNASFFDGNFGNTLILGKIHVNVAYGPFLKAEEMWNIDSKADDGRPASGKILARDPAGFGGGGSTNCTTAANGAQLTANYNLSVTGLNCSPVFHNSF